MFNHIPPDGKCEWVYIRPFVEQLNREAGTDYRLKECLDVKHRNIKAPEVLVEDSRGRRLLIERKTISWPRERFEILRSEYGLPDRILDALSGEFNEGLYALRIDISSLGDAYGKKHRKQWVEVSDTIASRVKFYKDRIFASRVVGSRSPVPWSCGSASPGDMGIPDDAKNTLIVIIYGGWDMLDGSFDNVDLIQKRLSEAKAEVQDELARLIDDAAAKFDAWRSDDNPPRILLVEPYGEIDIVLGDGAFEEMVQSTCLNHCIDQVWIAEEDWISEDDYNIAYRQCVTLA